MNPPTTSGSATTRSKGAGATSGFLVALLIVLLAGIWQICFPSSAEAVTCSAPLGFGYGTKVDNVLHYGAGATLTMINVSPIGECGIVRSNYIWRDTNNEAEVGWFQAGTLGGFTGCDPNGTPHVLVWAATNGTGLCMVRTDVVTATQRYWLQNINHDNHIQYFWNKGGTTSLGTFAVDFQVGESWSYDEIHASDGGSNLRAHATALQYFGSSGNWNNWATLVQWSPPGDLSGSHYCQYSTTNWQVKLTGNAC